MLVDVFIFRINFGKTSFLAKFQPKKIFRIIVMTAVKMAAPNT